MPAPVFPLAYKECTSGRYVTHMSFSDAVLRTKWTASPVSTLNLGSLY
jgi:hypothetical protein